MNTNDTEKTWVNLLASSAPTFAAEPNPPYGFVTSTLTVLRLENQQQREFERVGLRALWASFAALGVAVAVTVTVNMQQDSSDFDPGVRSLVQVDNLPFS